MLSIVPELSKYDLISSFITVDNFNVQIKSRLRGSHIQEMEEMGFRIIKYWLTFIFAISLFY